jgi:hypothetical protein
MRRYVAKAPDALAKHGAIAYIRVAIGNHAAGAQFVIPEDLIRGGFVRQQACHQDRD